MSRKSNRLFNQFSPQSINLLSISKVHEIVVEFAEFHDSGAAQRLFKNQMNNPETMKE